MMAGNGTDILEHLEMRVAAFERLGHRGGSEIDKFIIEHGRVCEIGDHTFSGTKGPQGECFANATRLAQAFDHYTYVEGYVAVFGIPIHHAWVIDRAGFVVEPTLAREDTDRIGGFFGVEFSTTYLVRSMMKNRCYGLLDGYYSAKTIAALIEGRVDFKPKKKG